jgi:hypothetical protein
MEEIIYDGDSLKFHHPFTLMIAGPTASGKSYITFRIIAHRRELLSEYVKKVIYCLPQGQHIEIPDVIKADRNVHFHEGLPNLESFPANDSTNGYILVLDDLMGDIDNDVMSLFCRQSHHRNISVIFLVQNIFFGGNKFFRTISLNCHYILVTKNPRDRKQISVLSSQLFPENVKFIKESFFDATIKPYSYLLFDLSQKTNDQIRFRTNIFPDDNPRNIIYIPVKK